MVGAGLNMQYLYQFTIRLCCTFLWFLLGHGPLNHGVRRKQLMGLPQNQTAFKRGTGPRSLWQSNYNLQLCSILTFDVITRDQMIKP